MLYLDDFIIDLKRSNQFGDESTTTDQPTLDILRWTNRFKKAIAVKFNWSWLFKSFTINLVAGTQTISIDSTIRKIIAIKSPSGAGRLLRISMKEALDWNTPVLESSDNSLLGWYSDFGIDDTTGVRKIQVWGKPGTTATLTAYGTKVITPFVVGDIATPANFLPFPDELVDALSDLVASRISKFKGSPTWAQEEKVAWDNIRLLFGEEQSDPASESTSPVPAYYKRKKLIRWHK